MTRYTPSFASAGSRAQVSLRSRRRAVRTACGPNVVLALHTDSRFVTCGTLQYRLTIPEFAKLIDRARKDVRPQWFTNEVVDILSGKGEV